MSYVTDVPAADSPAAHGTAAHSTAGERSAAQGAIACRRAAHQRLGGRGQRLRGDADGPPGPPRPYGFPAQFRVDQHHIEAAPLGRPALQAAQGRRAAAGRRDLHVLLRREGGRQRLGENTMVIDHENPNTCHGTPHAPDTEKPSAGTAPGAGVAATARPPPC